MPPIAVDGTREGVIAGTAAYMSPEQARGKAVDKRTDIWAFGCVLYEMLTARPAFRGETVSDTIAAILEREPDWSALPAQTPASIRRLLQRCLEKDPKRRLRDIGDARLEIEEALGAIVSARGGGCRACDVLIASKRGCPSGPTRLVGRGRCGSAGHRRRGDVAAAALGVLLAESAGRRDGHEIDGFRGSGASRRDFARREVRRLSLRPRWNVGRLGQPGRHRRRPQPHQRQRAGAAESRDPHGWLLSGRVAGHALEPRAGFRRGRSGRCRVGGSDDGRPASALPERGHLRARLVARRQAHRLPPAGGRRSAVRHRARREGRAVRSMLRGQASTTTFPSGRTTARSSTSSRGCRSTKATSGAFARPAASPSG